MNLYYVDGSSKTQFGFMRWFYLWIVIYILSDLSLYTSRYPDEYDIRSIRKIKDKS